MFDVCTMSQDNERVVFL